MMPEAYQNEKNSMNGPENALEPAGRMQKKQKITNQNYRMFLDKGIIELIDENKLNQALSNVKGIRGKYINEGRSLLIAEYYSGARPNELFSIKAKNITREGSFLKVFIKGSKNGLPRTIYLQLRRRPVKELLEYASHLMPDMLIFYHYGGWYKRRSVTKKGAAIERYEVSDRFRWYIKKWFSGVIPGSISPYYLRHNRMSKTALAGASVAQLRLLKGSKTDASIMPYIHLTTKNAKQMAKIIE